MAMAKVLPSDDMKKEAMKPLGNKAILATTGAALVSPFLSRILTDAYYRHKDQRALEAAWEKIRQKDPEMDTEEAREYFESMFDLSPSIMKHRTLALPALRQSMNYDLGGIPPQLASMLVSTDAARTKGDAKLNTGLLSGVSDATRVFSSLSGLQQKQQEAERRREGGS
jgi:transaldolase